MVSAARHSDSEWPSGLPPRPPCGSVDHDNYRRPRCAGCASAAKAGNAQWIVYTEEFPFEPKC